MNQRTSPWGTMRTPVTCQQMRRNQSGELGNGLNRKRSDGCQRLHGKEAGSQHDWRKIAFWPGPTETMMNSSSELCRQIRFFRTLAGPLPLTASWRFPHALALIAA